MKSLAKAILFFCAVILFSCEDKPAQQNQDLQILQSKEETNTEGSFYDNQLTKQVFVLSANDENVLEGKQGTLIAVPSGAFLDEEGNVYAGEVRLELKEALGASDMVLANLTTKSDKGERLSSGGMIFLEAFGEGKKLTINPDNPLYAEIPTEEVKPGMMLYDGERDEEGNILWKNPKPLQNYLIPVDIFSLDFLPRGFEKAVEIGLPFRGHKKYQMN